MKALEQNKSFNKNDAVTYHVRVSCACELGEASSRGAACRRCGHRPVRVRQSAPPLCTASASARAAFRCPGAAESYGESRGSMRML